VNELAVEAFDQDIEFDIVVVSERVDVTEIGDTKTEMAEGDIAKISNPAMILKEDIISTVVKCSKMWEAWITSLCPVQSTVLTAIPGSFYSSSRSLWLLTGTVDEDGKIDQARHVVALLLSSKGRA